MLPLETGHTINREHLIRRWIPARQRPRFVLSSPSPGLGDGRDVRAEGVRPRQRADKVQVDGAEGSNGPVSTAAEDQILRQRQGVGHARLQGQDTTGTSAHCTALSLTQG